MRRMAVGSLIVLSATGIAACGGDGDDVQAYCDISAETEGNAAEDFTQEDLDAIRDAAPDEIADDVNVIADAVEEFNDTGDQSIFQDEDVQAAAQETEDFEEENCEE